MDGQCCTAEWWTWEDLSSDEDETSNNSAASAGLYSMLLILYNLSCVSDGLPRSNALGRPMDMYIINTLILF